MRIRLLGIALSALLATGCSTTGAGPAPEPGRSETTKTTKATQPPTDSATPTEPAAPRLSPAARRLGLRTGWGPTVADLNAGARAVQDLPLTDLAGQVIVANYLGTSAPVDLLNDLHLGGVIAFSENVTSTDQIAQVNRELVASAGREWPLFLSVDQEGGIVERVQGDATRFPTFMSAGAANDPSLTTAAARAGAAELRGLGFTVDFAPDADVTSGPDDPTIGSRSAGSDPRLVAGQVSAAIAGFVDAGLIPVIKHFPGHGSVPADSHQTLPVQTETERVLMSRDLLPFRVAIAEGAPAVMVGHIDVRALDPGTPSSVSSVLISQVLRKRLGFHGLVVTDSLQMQGVAATRTSAESAVQTLLAGADVVLMPPDPAAARAGIIAAVESGRLPRRRLEQAAARQIALLLSGTRAGDGRPVGSAAEASAALSAGAITVASGPCTGRLVGPGVSVTGDPEAVAAFTSAAARAGLSTDGGDAVALIGYGGSPVTADVAVAMDTPYVLGASTAPIKIATYGDTPGAMRALVAVLLGRATAPGQLPVPVSGVERAGCR